MPRSLLLLLGCAALLTGCMPAVLGPDMNALTLRPAGAAWTAQDVLTHSVLPAAQVLPLLEAAQRAPVGSLIVACQRKGNVYGQCTHITRKLSEHDLTEETGLLGLGATLRPLESLSRRDLIFVLDSGVRAAHLPALQAEVQRLSGAPYQLNGQLDAFDCATYQNALQRAAGLPDAVPLDPRWQAHLPLGALTVSTNTLLWVGVQDGILP
ncbi:hypothetical protein K7W42_01325 [Deinococcus sp. HMF7604]|uniref:hypothetical protein n=1 Tax=Deinococcus betulae TaxID=2873312 RepID=UPI001CC9B187|nr:hypothetical protein [Deinococcus betulae]MBZ9749494.1 hypothetical protein [Deinococcus betulae]